MHFYKQESGFNPNTFVVGVFLASTLPEMHLVQYKNLNRCHKNNLDIETKTDKD